MEQPRLTTSLEDAIVTVNAAIEESRVTGIRKKLWDSKLQLSINNVNKFRTLQIGTNLEDSSKRVKRYAPLEPIGDFFSEIFGLGLISNEEELKKSFFNLEFKTKINSIQLKSMFSWLNASNINTLENEKLIQNSINSILIELNEIKNSTITRLQRFERYDKIEYMIFTILQNSKMALKSITHFLHQKYEIESGKINEDLLTENFFINLKNFLQPKQIPTQNFIQKYLKTNKIFENATIIAYEIRIPVISKETALTYYSESVGVQVSNNMLETIMVPNLVTIGSKSLNHYICDKLIGDSSQYICMIKYKNVKPTCGSNIFIHKKLALCEIMYTKSDNSTILSQVNSSTFLIQNFNNPKMVIGCANGMEGKTVNIKGHGYAFR